MGLDATVYCDCFEKGRLLVSPQPEWGVYVDEYGARSLDLQDIDLAMAFDQWNASDACQHAAGELVHHYLGNIALIALFREILGRQSDVFPVLLAKVIYSGSHAGDMLSSCEVRALQPETDRLADIHGNTPEEEAFIRDFESQLRELVACALEVGKPIVF